MAIMAQHNARFWSSVSNNTPSGRELCIERKEQEASRIEINGADVILPYPRMDTLALRFLFETRDLRPAVRRVLQRYPSP